MSLRKRQEVQKVLRKIKIPGVAPLDLAATLDCGQAFRWVAENGGSSFAGVVNGRAVRVELSDSVLTVSGTESEDSGFWRGYFALDIDYADLQRKFRSDPVLRKCVDYAPGIRVLRQDFFETLISFIISQNNNIPRIKGIIGRLCERYGKKLDLPGFETQLFSFPSAEQLAGSDVSRLSDLRAGYRTPWLVSAAEEVASGKLNARELASMSASDARARLLKVKGVGPKVADCVLLFGLGRFESFPVDVWIRRAMEKLFPSGIPECARNYAGIAQQYIFHYSRTLSE